MLIAGATGLTIMALAGAVAVFGGIALLAQPFLGIAVLTTFSHLDAVQKALTGFLPVSAFKLLTAATAAAVLLNGGRLRGQIAAMLRAPVAVMAIMFAILASVSIAWAEDAAAAVSAVERVFGLALLLVLVVVLADTSRRVGILAAVLVATSLVSACIVIVDFSFGVQLAAQSDAATTARTVEGVARSAGGSDHNPTTAASLLLVGVVFALVHALESPVWRRRLLLIVGVGTVATVLSFARSAVLAYAVIGFALLWRYRKWRYLPLLGALGVLVGIIALPLVPPEYWQRLSAVFGVSPDPTLGRRLSYNLIGADLFWRRPLLGVGAGNFPHHFMDISYRYMPGRVLIGRELHNMYLSVVVQYGLVGATAFFAMLAFAFRNLRAVCAAPARPEMRVWALALGYAFAAYLLVSLFLPNEETKYTWILPGLAAALYIVNERERSRP